MVILIIQMSRLKLSKYIAVILIGFICSCEKASIDERAINISKKICFVGEINDFTSNRNSPVEDVQNIGRNLYLKLKNYQNIGIDTCFYIKNGDEYFSVVRNKENKEGKIIFYYSEEEDIFKIRGFVGFN